MCFVSKRRQPCGVGGCKERHHTSLHVEIADVFDFSVLGANRTEDAVVRKDTANVLTNPLVIVPRVVAEVDPENQEVEVTSEVSNNSSILFLSPKGAVSQGRPVEVQSLREAGAKRCAHDLISVTGPMGAESLGNLVEAVSSPPRVTFVSGPGEAAEPESGPGEAGESLGVNLSISGLEVARTQRVPVEAEDSPTDIVVSGSLGAKSHGNPLEAVCSLPPNSFVLGAKEAEAEDDLKEAEGSLCKSVFYLRPNETEAGGGPVEASQSPGWDGNMFMLLVFFVHVWTKKILFLAGDCRILFGQVLQLFLFFMFLPSPIGGPVAEHCHGGGYPCVVL